MINFSHFRAVLKARNKEFIRDRASWAWNMIFPVLLIAGLAVAFGNDNKPLYTIGIFPSADQQGSDSHQRFLETRHLKFVDAEEIDIAVNKIERHQLDLLLDIEKNRYWINESSPSGYIAEKILIASISAEPDDAQTFTRELVSGKAVRYLDWVVPGILGLNMVFSCLFGVGYVIVRYRKSGVLKRLKATPLRAFEFLAAQIVSRMGLVMFITTLVFTGTHWVLDFTMNGSYLTLVIIMIVGSFSLISLGLVFAAQTSSEELAGGLLNTASWPMMILSGVWFSLEGAHSALRAFSNLLPLTHIVDAARGVMIDGEGLLQISGHLAYLAVFAIICLVIGARLFRWE